MYSVDAFPHETTSKYFLPFKTSQRILRDQKGLIN